MGINLGQIRVLFLIRRWFSQFLRKVIEGGKKKRRTLFQFVFCFADVCLFPSSFSLDRICEREKDKQQPSYCSWLESSEEIFFTVRKESEKFDLVWRVLLFNEDDLIRTKWSSILFFPRRCEIKSAVRIRRRRSLTRSGRGTKTIWNLSGLIRPNFHSTLREGIFLPSIPYFGISSLKKKKKRKKFPKNKSSSFSYHLFSLPSRLWCLLLPPARVSPSFYLRPLIKRGVGRIDKWAHWLFPTWMEKIEKKNTELRSGEGGGLKLTEEGAKKCEEEIDRRMIMRYIGLRIKNARCNYTPSCFIQGSIVSVTVHTACTGFTSLCPNTTNSRNTKLHRRSVHARGFFILWLWPTHREIDRQDPYLYSWI